jgi:hypothetical protein
MSEYDSMGIILNDVTVEMVAKALYVEMKIAQEFIDLSVQRGIIVPVENGYYRCVSVGAIEKAKQLIREKLERNEI